jgi:hypothetical protein
MWYMYTMEYYSAKRNNDSMCFEGKLMQLEDRTLSKVSQQEYVGTCFLSYVEDRSKRYTTL